MTTPWSERPIELANLLNPAFCSIILCEAINSYQESSNTYMPYSLSFLILPIILHKPTRDLLPNTVASKFHTWVHRYESVRIGFETRAKNMVPYTKEGIIFSTSAGFLSFSDDAQLKVNQNPLGSVEWPLSADADICRKKARFLGRWFTRAGNFTTVYAFLGVKP